MHIKDEQEYGQFHLFRDKDLFKRLDSSCPVINLNIHQYFAHLLPAEQFGLSWPEEIFPKSFHDVSKIIFTPSRSITDKASSVRDMLTAGPSKKWLSIQVHDMSINGKAKHLDRGSVDQSMACANALLERGDIDYVFFATDEEKLQDYAHSLISDEKAYVVVSKDSTSIADYDVDYVFMRNKVSIDYTLLDWYLVGEATYCMSPSVYQSAYSKTAVARGNCLYINYLDGANCDTSKAVSSKEYLLSLGRGSEKLERMWQDKEQVNREQIWQSVEITEEIVAEQCIKSSTPNDIIRKYWTESRKHTS